MKETLVVLETAKLAKEKGFDILCNTTYQSNSEDVILYWYPTESFYGYSDLEDIADFLPTSNELMAPSQQLLQKWLREKHSLFVFSEIFDKGFLEKNKFCFQYKIFDESEPSDNFIDVSMSEYKTYEEALEMGLLNALKLIKVQ